MSYVVLARKYRPKTFLDMVGQGHVVQALTNALTTQRLHHAYLFTGTRGVGKTTVSRILAKSLNCTGPDGHGQITATPCGQCQACRDIDAGRFVDYTELDAASNRGVDEVQALLEQAVYKPVQGRFKVFMIDEVHMLSNTAFNAMLKTLEEPPEYLKFVLATTDPQKVPVTVLSRCLQFSLRAMAPDTIREHLRTVLTQEAVDADDGALQYLAKAARGSMRDALSLTDQAIAFGNGVLQEAAVRQMLGASDPRLGIGLLEALANGDGAAVVAQIEALRLQGFSAVSVLDELLERLQRMALMQWVPQATRDADPADADTARLARQMPPDTTQLLYSLCLHGRSELGLAPDEYAALTMVLLRVLAFQPPTEKKTLDLAPTPAAAPVRVAPVPTPAATMPAVSAPTPAAAADPMPTWPDIVQQLIDADAISALTRELALQSQRLSASPSEWVLQVSNPALWQSGAPERLESALRQAGFAVSLAVRAGATDDTPAKRLAAAAQARQAQAEATLLGDPFVQRMMHEFGGKIVPGSIVPL